MPLPRKLKIAALTLALSVCSSLSHDLSAVLVLAQQPQSVAVSERERGIKLYEQGEIKEAIKALRAAVKSDESDALAFYHLGLAYTAQEDLKDARQSFEKALKLRPDFVDARAALAHALLLLNKRPEAGREAEQVLKADERHALAHYVLGEVRYPVENGRLSLSEAEKALAVKPDFALALLLKAKALRTLISAEHAGATRAQVEDFISQSKATVAQMDSFLRAHPQPENWEELLKDLRAFAVGDFTWIVYRPADVTEKAKIISKPQPMLDFTGANGKVVLQLILRHNGVVDNIRVIYRSDERLLKPCVESARKIKFTPAMKDGRAVSQYLRVEYNFSVSTSF